MSNLVICCDGTWDNSAGDQQRADDLTPDNVFQLFNAIDDSQDSCKYYLPGTCGNSLFERLLGNPGSGGLQDDIVECYQWLARHFKPGDHVFLFGFGHGAWTVRTLMTMIDQLGIADLRQSKNPSQQAEQLYRKNYRRKQPLERSDIHFHSDSRTVRFCALFDPAPGSTAEEPLSLVWPDSSPNQITTANAHPGLHIITDRPQPTADSAQQPQATPALELLACSAETAGLQFYQHFRQTCAAARSARSERLTEQARNHTPLGTLNDNTIVTPVDARLPWNWTGIYLEAGQRYRFAAQGYWQGANQHYGPDGEHSEHPLHEPATVECPSGLLERVEANWRKLVSAPPQALARRVTDANRFVLIGVIANESRLQADQDSPLMTTFEIGNGCEFECGSSGYLYCFANDEWGHYEDNCGEVMLSIQRI